MRGLIQSMAYILALIAIRKPISTWLGVTPKEVFLLICRTLIGFGGITLSFAAIPYLPLAESQVLAQITPIFASFYAWIFLGECWHLTEVVSAILGILGVVFIARPASLLKGSSALAASSSRLVGITFSLLGSACAGGAFVYVRMLGTRVKVHWLVVALYQALGQLFGGALALKLAGQSLSVMGWDTAAWSICMGLIAFCGSSCMTWGMQREKSATGSVVQSSLTPVCAMLFQLYFVPGEKLQLSTLFGFVVMFSGMLTTVTGKAHRENLIKNATVHHEHQRPTP